jgi:hypothetical protein
MRRRVRIALVAIGPLLLIGSALGICRSVGALAREIRLTRGEVCETRDEVRQARDEVSRVRDEVGRAREEVRQARAEARAHREADRRALRAILDEQKKRTIDDVYASDEVIERSERALRLYRDGDYAGAFRVLSPVRSLVRDDDKAMFCLIAAEFRINPQDRERYGAIVRGLRDLRLNGYRSDELDEIVAYIEAEEAAMGDAPAIAEMAHD